MCRTSVSSPIPFIFFLRVTSVTFLVSVPVTVERVGTVSTSELPVRRSEQRNVRWRESGKKREGMGEETRLG